MTDKPELRRPYMPKKPSSAGHKLGQEIGNWWEPYIMLPLLQRVAASLDLYLDHGYHERTCRGAKIVWEDDEGNGVDYDFVLELGGTDEEVGVPVAFVEGFWRRGGRHSKDKARDDSGKLLPMKDTYPTARFLGIVAGGELTKPARTLIHSRDIDLLYVVKDQVLASFEEAGLVMTYPDEASEADKSAIQSTFDLAWNEDKKKEVAQNLFERMGEAAVNAYVARVQASLSAIPVEVRITELTHSDTVVFKEVGSATAFLKDPSFGHDSDKVSYRYEVTYSDGSEFSRDIERLSSVRRLHDQLVGLSDHMEALAKKKVQ
ncbi:MAG: hypothetical protein AAF730_00565 [Bacteroidota bacterium]